MASYLAFLYKVIAPSCHARLAVYSTYIPQGLLITEIRFVPSPLGGYKMCLDFHPFVYCICKIIGASKKPLIATSLMIDVSRPISLESSFCMKLTDGSDMIYSIAEGKDMINLFPHMIHEIYTNAGTMHSCYYESNKLIIDVCDIPVFTRMYFQTSPETAVRFEFLHEPNSRGDYQFICITKEGNRHCYILGSFNKLIKSRNA